MFGFKPVEEINEEDLEDLVGVKHEGHHIDFKNHMYQPIGILTREQEDEIAKEGNESARTQKRNIFLKEQKQQIEFELCEDIAAFANADGGWIICGMKDKRNHGIAEELTGIGPIADFETEKHIKRLEGIAKRLLPQVPGLRVLPVRLDKLQKMAILIHIPRSYVGPHGIQNQDGRGVDQSPIVFRVRRSTDNGFMSMAEIRRAFNISETLEDKLSQFRNQRVEVTTYPSSDARETPVEMQQVATGIGGMPRLLLHAIPINNFLDKASVLDLSVLKTGATWIEKEHLLNTAPANGFFNFRGFVIPKPSDQPHRSSAYMQFYRNGTIEYAENLAYTDMNNATDADVKVADARYIALRGIERTSIKTFTQMIRAQKNLGIEPPYMILISLINVGGFYFVPDGMSYAFFLNGFFTKLKPNRHDRLLLPDIVVQGSEDLKQILRPIFDVLWQAGSYQRSESYSLAGERIVE